MASERELSDYYVGLYRRLEYYNMPTDIAVFDKTFTLAGAVGEWLSFRYLITPASGATVSLMCRVNGVSGGNYNSVWLRPSSTTASTAGANEIVVCEMGSADLPVAGELRVMYDGVVVHFSNTFACSSGLSIGMVAGELDTPGGAITDVQLYTGLNCKGRAEVGISSMQNIV